MKKISIWAPLCVMALMAPGCRKAGDHPGTPPADGEVIPKEAWQDSGFDTPEATIATYLWAGREANLEKMQECMSERDALAFAKLTKGESKKGVLEGLRAAWGNARGYRIVSKRQRSPDHVELEFGIEGWKGPPERMTLKRVGTAWKIDDLQKRAEENRRKSLERQRSIANKAIDADQ
jgi:hypothetical protein